jgi:hypothetical protein
VSVLREVPQAAFDELKKEIILAGEVRIEGATREAGSLSNLVDGCTGKAATCKGLGRRFENLVLGDRFTLFSAQSFLSRGHRSILLIFMSMRIFGITEIEGVRLECAVVRVSFPVTMERNHVSHCTADLRGELLEEQTQAVTRKISSPALSHDGEVALSLWIVGTRDARGYSRS